MSNNLGVDKPRSVDSLEIMKRETDSVCPRVRGFSLNIEEKPHHLFVRHVVSTNVKYGLRYGKLTDGCDDHIKHCENILSISRVA